MAGLSRTGSAASVARGLAAGAVALCLAFAGCRSLPRDGSIHTVRPGENIYRIALYYGVSQSDIIRANDIDDVTTVSIGQQLRIPGASKAPPPKSLAMSFVPSAPQGDLRALAKRESHVDFAWPLRGRVSSSYGWRNGRRHEGIDIPAKKGAKVRAAEAGKVIHSGGLGDYGRVVIIKHAGRYSTVYAHNRRNRVKKGAFVEKGDVVAEVGSSGNASGPHLHFEIRRDRKAQDPRRYLP